MTEPSHNRDNLEENLKEVARHLQEGSSNNPPHMPNASESQPKKTNSLARFGWLGMMVAFALGKFKFLLMGLKLMKFSSMITMFVSMWAYSTIFGWPYAVGFVLLIVVHELGHGMVMRWLGIPAGAPVFIPFMGAVIAMKGRPRNAYIEALVAFGGPVLGSVAAVFCLVIALITESDFWMSLAFSGFMINLFNLLPVSPLDGGRIVGAFSRKMWIVGFLLLIPAYLASKSPMLLLVLIIGLIGLVGRKNEPEGYFDIPKAIKIRIALGYFILAGLLAVGVSFSHVPVPH
ncbi:MAG: site-2 protease family protein [bacterium]|nr:site-2 protease family protein [bacterium]